MLFRQNDLAVIKKHKFRQEIISLFFSETRKLFSDIFSSISSEVSYNEPNICKCVTEYQVR